MSTPFEFEHAVEVGASARAAWEFWTNVENWKFDPTVEWAKLDGDFRAGATGETKPRGNPPVRWRVAEVREAERAVIVMDLPGATPATARFELSFEPVSDDASRLRQRITLEGPGADSIAAVLGEAFREMVRAGMKRLADAIAESREP